MQNKIATLVERIEDTLNAIDDCDSYEDGSLERAMHYFCGNHDKGYGMKCAIKETLYDQYEHHSDDLTEEELKQLLAHLMKTYTEQMDKLDKKIDELLREGKEEEATQLCENEGEMTRSDAQGVVEARQMQL